MKGGLARVLWRIIGGKACHCPVLTHGVSAVIGLLCCAKSLLSILGDLGLAWEVKMRSVALIKPLGVKMLKNDC